MVVAKTLYPRSRVTANIVFLIVTHLLVFLSVGNFSVSNPEKLKLEAKARTNLALAPN